MNYRVQWKSIRHLGKKLTKFADNPKQLIFLLQEALDDTNEPDYIIVGSKRKDGQ